MFRLFSTIASLLFAISWAHSQPASTSAVGPQNLADRTVVHTVFDFTETKKMTGWIVVNDGVMGGKSKGGFTLKSGHMTFSGVTNTDGGGFSSIRGQLPNGVDLEKADGFVVRLRTDGKRSFKIDLRQSAPARTRALSFRAPIRTDANEGWQEVKVPFSAFKASWRGRAIPSAKLNVAAATQLGLYIFDGKDGPFRLEVESVSTYVD